MPKKLIYLSSVAGKSPDKIAEEAVAALKKYQRIYNAQKKKPTQKP